MRKTAIPLLLLLLLTFAPELATAEKIRLSTVASQMSAIPDVQNYVALLVEGAPPESRKLTLTYGPGQIALDTASDRWLWNWQPTPADVGRSFAIVIRDQRSKRECRFNIDVKAFAYDRLVADFNRGKFYSGIPTTFRVKQPGHDGAYRTMLTVDGVSLVDTMESTLTVKPDLQELVGKKAKLSVQYCAPFTNKWITIYDRTTKISYPPFRAPGSMEVEAGDPIFFHAALGVQPNFYTPIPSWVLIATSDGYFEDTVRMIGGYSAPGDDPFSMFEQPASAWSIANKHFCFDFGIRPTEKVKTITEKYGRVVQITLFDPITKQTTSMEIRVFPRAIQPTE